MHVLKKIINKYFSLKSSNETEILQSGIKDSRDATLLFCI